MAKLTKRRALAAGIPAAIALAAIVALARSPSLRASFRAAAVAFRDPSLVRGPDRSGHDDDPGPRGVDLDQPEIAGDFDPLPDTDLADAGDGDVAIATLTLPDLGIAITQRTLRFVRYFSADEKGRPAFLERFRRAGRYREHIEQALRDAELPEDLLWLVAIESAFNPQATSPAGAVGLFQFMPETGARYGLAQSDFVDDRRSITRSTAAGVAHLGDLFERYKRWDLALAAYNYGHERLDESIERLKKRRGPRDADKPIEIKDLADARVIPKETANFVPQIQAFAIVAANRGRFGLDDLDPVAPFDLGEVAVPAGTPLRVIAQAAGVSIGVLRDYNPDLLRDQAPPGGDAIVLVPADRVSRALAAFPALLAREDGKRALASAAAEEAAAAKAPPSASARAAAAPAKPAEPPPDTWTLGNGVVIERKHAQTAQLAIDARIEILEPTRGGTRATGRTFDVETIRGGDLASGLERAARQIRGLATGSGEAAVEARRRAGDARRRMLDKAPYGASWVALGDRLFGAGHPLSGAVLLAPTLPLTSVAIAENALRGWARVKVTVAGPVERAALSAEAQRALADVLEHGGPIAQHPREDRIALTSALPSQRVLFGWIAPADGDAERATLRLAVLALAHNEVGKAARALVVERHVAVHVRGMLDVGDRASVAAIEVVPAVQHDAAAVERELDRAIEAFVEQGPTEHELVAVKTQLNARLQSERLRAGSASEPKDAALARIQRTSERASAVTADDLRAFVKKVFTRGHRVVVTTNPRG